MELLHNLLGAGSGILVQLLFGLICKCTRLSRTITNVVVAARGVEQHTYVSNTL